jgi:hypothetical protein
MMITLPLTPEEEARLVAIAEGKGVSTDTLLQRLVQEILVNSQVPEGAQVTREEREKQIEELFAALDNLPIPAGIREEVFHRENWYR